MEVKFSSKMSVDFQRTAWHYSPEYSAFHKHRFENLQSYMVLIYVEDKAVFIQTDPVYCTDWTRLLYSPNLIVIETELCKSITVQ
jgi:hypothetical protein